MKMYLTTAMFAATMALTATPAAAATTLTFGDACGGTCTDYDVISQSYGDIAGVLDVSYRSVDAQGSISAAGDASYWSTGYANLSDVLYGAAGKTLEITFRLLDPTKMITFNSVAFAGYGASNTNTVLSLFSLESGGSALASSGSIYAPISAFSTWAPGASSAEGFRFHFGSDAYYAGVDNLTYTISPAVFAGAVPEPTTWLSMILGFGLIGAAARRRVNRTVAIV